MTRAALTALLVGALLAGCPRAECPPGYVRTGDLCVVAPDGGGMDGSLASITIVPTPDFVLLHAGQSRSISLAVSAVGVTSGYDIGVTGLPAGVTATTATHATPATAATLTITFSASASAAPVHANAMLVAMGAGAGLASPLPISVQVAGPSGVEVMAPVTLWTAPSASVSRAPGGCLVADSGGVWVSVATTQTSPASVDDHLLRLGLDGTIRSETTVHPSAADLGVDAAFDAYPATALCVPRAAGGVLVVGALIDPAGNYVLWVAAIDVTGARVGTTLIGQVSAGAGTACNAAPWSGDLVAGCSDSSIHRYGADANVVSSFGVSGSVLISGDFVGVDDTGGVLVQSTGGIARYQSEGRADLDGAFAGDGFLNLADPDPTKVFTVFPSLRAGLGGFFVAGASELVSSPGTTHDGLVWRVLDDGTVDRSYGTAGLYRLSSSYRNDVTVVAALSDGSILVGVNQYDMSGTSSAARIDRLTPAGARDDAFGAGGEGINVGVQFAFGVDERTGRIYVVDTNGSDLIFHVFWL